MNMKSSFNRKGSGVVLALAAMAVMSVSFYLLVDQVISQRKAFKSTADVVKMQFSLQSVLEFALFGVKQKFCFNNEMLNDLDCDLGHRGSVERLILSAEQETYLRDLIIAKSAVKTGLTDADLSRKYLHSDEIELEFPWTNITKAHPLFPIIEKFSHYEFESAGALGVSSKDTLGFVRAIFRRVSNVNLPTPGKEIFLEVEVAFLGKKKALLHLGNKPMQMLSSISIYPREVGSFALLIANDLRLDKPWNATLGSGDVALNMFSERSAVIGRPGLVFKSPVFVNRDIHLPHSQSDLEGKHIFSPVTFTDKVYLGNGIIRKDGQPFRPISAGGHSDSLWTQVTTFGGFLRGIESD